MICDIMHEGWSKAQAQFARCMLGYFVLNDCNNYQFIKWAWFMARSHPMRCIPICHGYLFVNISIVDDQDWKMVAMMIMKIEDM